MPASQPQPRPSALIKLGWAALAAVVGIAVIWPWYNYKVNAHLLGRDLEALGEEIEQESRALDRQARQQLAQARIPWLRIRPCASVLRGSACMARPTRASPWSSSPWARRISTKRAM